MIAIADFAISSDQTSDVSCKLIVFADIQIGSFKTLKMHSKMHLNALFVASLSVLVLGRVHDSSEFPGENYLVRSLTEKNHEEIFQNHGIVFVKFFTHWYVLKGASKYVVFERSLRRLTEIITETINYILTHICRCYYSKKILKTWEIIGEHYASNANILIAEIDCEVSRTLCKSFKVREYPTLLMVKNGKEIEKYQGEKSIKDITAFADGFIDNSKGKDDN